MSTAQAPLLESDSFSYKIVEDTGGTMRLQGVYQLADVKNRNNRVYSRSLWEKILNEGSDFNRRLQSKLVLGMLGHPADGKTDLAHVSHVVTKVWLEDKFLPECVVCRSNGGPHAHIMAEEEVLDTPEGRVLAELYRKGVQLGVSSRGSGSVRGGPNEQLVSDDFRLECWDHVLDPSTPGAFPKVIAESVVEAVEKLISPECNATELRGYRKILAEMSDTDDPTVRANAARLVEAVDVRLASGACQCSVPVAIKNENLAPAAPTVVRVSEDTMSISPTNPEVQEMVSREVSKFRDGLEHKVAEALADADRYRTSSKKLEADLAASKKLGEELVLQLKNARFQLETYKAQPPAEVVRSAMYDDEHTVEEALGAAKQVIEALLVKVDTIEEAVARAEGAERLVEAVLLRERRKSVLDHIDKVLATESTERAKGMRKLLSEAQTVEEVNRKYGSLRKIMSEEAPAPAPAAAEPKASRDPLPPATGLSEEKSSLVGQLAESTQLDEATITPNQSLSRAILRRSFASTRA
jgi:predicted RNase H-like HicB family nuclease